MLKVTDLINNQNGGILKMKINVFDKYKCYIDQLLNYGFYKVGNTYIYEKELKDKSMYVRFEINESLFEIKVFDDEDEYLPFNIKNTTSDYIIQIKNEVSIYLEDILKNCFESLNIKNKLLDYVKDKYQSEPEYLWADTPNTCIVRTNKKWYGIFMDIPYQSLQISKEGKIDVLNLKNDSQKIQDLIDHKHYFPAYHMNKKYWISILLDNYVNIEEVKKLIDESYLIVNKRG